MVAQQKQQGWINIETPFWKVSPGMLKRFIILSVALWVAACASRVNIDYDERVNFFSLKTFALLQPETAKSGDVRLNNPLLAKRINTTLEQYLEARHYTPVSEKPDFYVTYHLRIKQEVESRNVGMSLGVGMYYPHTAIGMHYGYPEYEVYSYEVGVLTIDILDGRDKTLIWRGSTSRRLFDGETPQKSKKIINEVVKEIMDNFPPGKRK